jgi:signal peptidase I
MSMMSEYDALSQAAETPGIESLERDDRAAASIEVGGPKGGGPAGDTPAIESSPAIESGPAIQSSPAVDSGSEVVGSRVVADSAGIVCSPATVGTSDINSDQEMSTGAAAGAVAPGLTLEAEAVPVAVNIPAAETSHEGSRSAAGGVPTTIAVQEGLSPEGGTAHADADRESPWVHMSREIFSGFQTLVSAAVYATLIVTFGVQVARVDGLSMAPTLEDRDRLIVNKLVYELGDPRPGDIVMLYYPLNPEKMFVKRVIAKEGDTVRIIDGRVYVNDIPLADDYVPAEFRSHDDWGPEVIKQGYYFVLGDHRNNSSDSRHWGQVPKKYIVGKVKVRWWPLQDARIF